MKKLGKYEVLGELGHGAMGIVYRARDPIINRLVALKTITTGVADDPAMLERFYREAQSAGGLQHPHIVTIYDMGQAGELPYIAMELVEGENLEQLIARRPSLPITLKLVYAMQACRAFDFAHKRGIVHRDIKPGNVMIGKDGTVKVVDFGIARVLETSRTQTGMLIGTFAYMSPEQYHGEHADERSDIWSFGVLVYELLSYRRPFTGPTPASLMHGICNEEPTPLSKVLPECTEELERTVSKMLRKSPSERYESMEDVLLDLNLICEGLQAESVAELLEQSSRLLDQESFGEARDVLRQALQFESGNQRARALLEKANAGLKRVQNRPKAKQLVEKGQALLEEGKLQEARMAVENALHLDSGFAPAEDLQRAIQIELDRARIIAELLDAARQHLAEGLPDDAELVLAKVLEIEPRNEQVQNLQQQVLKEKAEGERCRRLLAGMQQARGLWTRQDYGECMEVLRDLEREFPGEAEVGRLLETVREDLLEQQKQQDLQQSRNLSAEGAHGDAISLLSDLQKRFPNDEEIRGLLEKGRNDQRNQGLSLRLAEARSLLAAGQYDAGVSLLSSLIKIFPDDPEIPPLLENARQLQAGQLRQRGIAEAIRLLDARRFKECLASLATLEKHFPGNEEILTLQRAVREQQSKEEKQQLLEGARYLLTARRFEEAIALLVKFRADFPDDAEIAKLLATAREDLDEQQKQEKLTEAKALLAEQSFAKALAVLDDLSLAHPKDQAGIKLRALVQRELDERSKAEKIQLELEILKKLTGEKRYPEVIARTNELLAKFPSEPNFIRLAEFATSRQASIEKELSFKKIFEESSALVNAKRFKEAIRAVQDGLKTFPGNSELQALVQEAETQQRKLEVRQKIEQRVREIKVKINREELSDAISLAKQTLMTLGPDTDLTHLLSSAEVELQAREKKRIQERTLETIRTEVVSGDLDAASRKIDEALASNALDPLDPRIERLSDQINDARAKPAGGSVAGPPSLSKEYAFLQASPLAGTPLSPEKTAPPDSSTAQSLANSAVLLPYIAPAKPSEFARRSPGEASANPLPETAGTETKPATLSSGVPVIEIKSNMSQASAVPSAALEAGPAQPQPAPSRRTLLVLAILSLAILSAVGVGLYRTKIEQSPKPLTANAVPKKDSQPTETIHTEEQLWDEARGLVAAGRYLEAQQDLNKILAWPAGGVHQADARQYLEETIPQLQAENAAHEALARHDFQAARRAANLLKQKGGNSAELIAQIGQEEQQELKQLENQFDQLKRRDNSEAVQQLKALQPRFQALADDGGAQSGEALSFARSIPGAIADIHARAKKNIPAPRCVALKERVQLGEVLNEEDQSFLKDNCY